MKLLYKTIWGIMGLFERYHGRGLKREPHLMHPDDALIQKELSRGNWVPLRDALAKAGKNWDRRGSLVGLASVVKTLPAWVEDWLANEPKKSAPHLVAGTALIQVAWEIRGSGRAVTVSEKVYDAFFETLTRAEHHLRLATKIAPSDPTPWCSLIQSGIGLELEREIVEQRFGKLVRRNPNEVNGHSRMLQYNCEKWHGSEEIMWAFVRKATANLPMGSLRYELIPAAHLEQAIQEGPMQDDDEGMDRYYRNPKVRADIFNAYQQMRIDPPTTSPDAISAFNYFAHAMWRCGSPKSAADAFRFLDNRITSLPWCYEGGEAKHFKLAQAAAFG